MRKRSRRDVSGSWVEKEGKWRIGERKRSGEVSGEIEKEQMKEIETKEQNKRKES